MRWKQGDVVYEVYRQDFVRVVNEFPESRYTRTIRLNGGLAWHSRKEDMARAAITFAGPCRV